MYLANIFQFKRNLFLLKLYDFYFFQVFQNSIFNRNIDRFGPNFYFKDDQKYHLVGDSTFALKTWLMSRYKGDNLNRMHRHHNYCLSSEIVKIEHCFGGYKGRWRRVQYINTYNICKAIEIATAACVLHNFCILNWGLLGVQL